MDTAHALKNTLRQTGASEASPGGVSPDEKLARRLEAWLSPPGVEFTSAEAGQDYRARVNRIIDAIRLKKTPDRVPIVAGSGGFNAAYYGYTQRDLMYDAEKAAEVATRATLDFRLDGRIAMSALPGRMYETLGYSLYRWPGHGLSEDAEFEFNAGEYMPAAEYDAFIADPSGYWLRTHLPQIMGALAPFGNLMPPSHIIEIGSVAGNVSRYGLPEVETALEKLVRAGMEAQEWREKVEEVNLRLAGLGFPAITGGWSRAPFDAIGDTLRGTRGVILDMYRRPAKLIEAMERVVPILVHAGVAETKHGDSPVIDMWLHMAANGFLSDEQFRTFYWPTLRQVISGLIAEGLVPRLFVLGDFASRLEVIRDLPPGKTIWSLGYTDMALAKKVLGGVVCLQGNVPDSLMHTGSPDEVAAFCRRLIETAGRDGGFILSTSAGIGVTNGKIENVREMVRCVMG